MKTSVDVTIIGGGMITNDLILPSVYRLQRSGLVGEISVCALNTPPLKALKENPEFRAAFPNQDFRARPDLSEPPDRLFPELYKEVLAALPERQVVVVALPDQLHYGALKEALAAKQHVLCVKPLVLSYLQAEEIRELAYGDGLFVGVEYHKRFDRRSLLARRQYREGQFGEFKMGEAKLVEPYYYRSSNFQNWFTCEQTDPFVYIGCHYVDLVYFITGLHPVEVSVAGIKGRFPNGNEGYMWSNGRVRFENGALLSVSNGLGYPDLGAGSNEQCLTMFCEGEGRAGLIKHNDQFRGVSHSYLEPSGAGGSHFNFINPDFYRLVPREGEGAEPVGYGVDSIAAIISRARQLEEESASLGTEAALERRQALIRETDERGLIATPANSYINELVVEAARLSILADGRSARILYEGEHPCVEIS